jgi:hypothetical protein
MGTSSACARIGSFLALYVVWLVRIYKHIVISDKHIVISDKQ